VKRCASSTRAGAESRHLCSSGTHGKPSQAAVILAAKVWTTFRAASFQRRTRPYFWTLVCIPKPSTAYIATHARKRPRSGSFFASNESLRVRSDESRTRFADFRERAASTPGRAASSKQRQQPFVYGQPAFSDVTLAHVCDSPAIDHDQSGHKLGQHAFSHSLTASWHRQPASFDCQTEFVHRHAAFGDAQPASSEYAPELNRGQPAHMNVQAAYERGQTAHVRRQPAPFPHSGASVRDQLAHLLHIRPEFWTVGPGAGRKMAALST
jgi:hypothetical protein